MITALARHSIHWLALVGCVVCATLLALTLAGQQIGFHYGAWAWSNGLTVAQAAPLSTDALPIVNQKAAQVDNRSTDTSGDLTLLTHAPTITAAQIDAVLASYGSPAQGHGTTFYDLGVQYGINPAIALAFYVHESSAGTAGAAVATRSVGNIICAGWRGRCVGRFRAYDTWHDSIEDWYKLIRREYIDGRGCRTVADVIPIYAPAVENDVAAYIAAVNGLVAQWAQQSQSQTDSAIHGAPLHGPLAITQGFGVGSHAPAEIWGGVDYAAQTGDPLYAIIDGTAEVSQTWPCGLGLRIKGPVYWTLYCHMSRIDVQSGATIHAGQAVGAAGATGAASGPHVHVEVRENGRIIDPTGLIQEVR